jgi:hypothetical protein
MMVFAATMAISPALAVSDEEVVAAIERARAFLYSQQKEGNWELAPKPQNAVGSSVKGDQWGGLTAIATYALLASGESPQDARLQPAIEFLRKAEIAGVYALGMRAQVWTFLPASAENREAVRRDAELLIRGMKERASISGFWNYVVEPNTGSRADHSVSQYGVLGLWACADADLAIPRDVWQRIETCWLTTQTVEGGWPYMVNRSSNQPATVPMTLAGIATLFITQDQLHVSDALGCNGNQSNPAIDRGIEWVTSRYDKLASNTYPYYALYGVERIGVASGRKYLGTINWYEAGAQHLLENQLAAGSWNSKFGEGSEVVDTAFGLLFLSRGRAPLVMNKLQYDIRDDAKDESREANWNQRPRDAAGLARYIGKQAERDLHWQIVNLDVPVEELHDAPILYIAGNEALNFTEDEKAKLSEYVEGGGLIFGTADCGERAFASSFQQLGESLFPAYRFRELPDDHVIYRNQQFQRSKWQKKPSILGLSNGVRELMVLIPTADASRAYQMQTASANEELYQFGANLFLYSVEKQNLRFKGQTYVIRPKATAAPTRTVKVARLQYDGNWDPEPSGWRRLATLLANEAGVGLTVEPVALGTGDLAGFDIAHLTGTGDIKFDSTIRKQLQDYVKAGGTLVIDAAGGAKAFAESAEAELKATFPDYLKGFAEPLPAEHPLYALPDLLPEPDAKDAKGPKKPGEVSYRTYTRVNRVGRLRTPRIRAMLVNDRPAVLFSREDLSAGMVGQPVDGLFGYDPRSAMELMAKIVLYAGYEGKVPPTSRYVGAATRPATRAGIQGDNPVGSDPE